MLPQDMEDYEEALAGLHHSFTGGDAEDLQAVDEAMGVIARRYNPKNALAAYEFTNPLHHVSSRVLRG